MMGEQARRWDFAVAQNNRQTKQAEEQNPLDLVKLMRGSLSLRVTRVMRTRRSKETSIKHACLLLTGV